MIRIIMRPSLAGGIKCCTSSVCPSICLSVRHVPPIFSKQESHGTSNLAKNSAGQL